MGWVNAHQFGTLFTIIYDYDHIGRCVDRLGILLLYLAEHYLFSVQKKKYHGDCNWEKIALYLDNTNNVTVLTGESSSFANIME